MKKKIIFLSILYISFLNLYSQEPVGKVIFVDGTSLEFSEMRYFVSQTSGCQSDAKGVQVFYENTCRTIPFSKIDYFEVNSWEMYGSINISNVNTTVKTKTGIILQTKYKRLKLLHLMIFDKLTGEMKEQEVFFGKNSKLNIKEIDFY